MISNANNDESIQWMNSALKNLLTFADNVQQSVLVEVSKNIMLFK